MCLEQHIEFCCRYLHLSWYCLILHKNGDFWLRLRCLSVWQKSFWMDTRKIQQYSNDFTDLGMNTKQKWNCINNNGSVLSLHVLVASAQDTRLTGSSRQTQNSRTLAFSRRPRGGCLSYGSGRAYIGKASLFATRNETGSLFFWVTVHLPFSSLKDYLGFKSLQCLKCSLSPVPTWQLDTIRFSCRPD